jgi:two-component system phosphate regulon response regulator PhoB
MRPDAKALYMRFYPPPGGSNVPKPSPKLLEASSSMLKKVLIVDEPGIRELVETTLGIDDYQIFMAENGQKAVEIARAEMPDLTIMDIMMPGGIDGLEVTRILKKDPRTRRGIIIILSARGEESEKQEGLKAGADDYFAKPFSPLALIKKVEEVLD